MDDVFLSLKHQLHSDSAPSNIGVRSSHYFTTMSDGDGLFRSWTSPKGKDPEVVRLEKEAEETRQKIAALREQGRQRRAHRLESLDALETRRMTLMEILKRMEKELTDKDVDDYADVLASVFSERVIYAHRAIGLEALLCQFMHQMLAKQHQLKIMKKTGKDLQKIFHHHKRMNREEFHSYEALAVQLEAMRLSLEAQYDDVFAAQHALLAQLNHVEAHGTMTNYMIVKPPEKEKKQPTLKFSNKHQSSPAPKLSGGGESDDDERAIVNEILKGKDLVVVDLDSDSNSNKEALPPVSPEQKRKSARDRRREIEQRRLAAGRGISNISTTNGKEDKHSAREKIRALEAKRGASNEKLPKSDVSLLKEQFSTRNNSKTSSTKEGSSHTREDDDDDDDAESARERRARRKSQRQLKLNSSLSSSS